MPSPGPAILSVRDVTVRFGGIVALDSVSFDVAEGQIVGLIGPNGAGKTTLFNCLSRIYTPDRGEITFRNGSLLASPPHRIADLGLGRTFQNLALFPTLSVRQNVMVGVHCRTRSDFLSNALAMPWVGREERRDAPAGRCAAGVPGTASAWPIIPPPGCPTARSSAWSWRGRWPGKPALLLADEPAAGLNHEEVGALGAILKSIRDDRGVTILLVEHHMGLVMQVSDRVVVLDFGRKIAEGSPAEIQRNPEVIRAYLGDELEVGRR